MPRAVFLLWGGRREAGCAGVGCDAVPLSPPPWVQVGKDPRPPHAGCPRVGSGAADGCTVPKEAVRPPQGVQPGCGWLSSAQDPRAVGWILLGLQAIMGSPGGVRAQGGGSWGPKGAVCSPSVTQRGQASCRSHTAPLHARGARWERGEFPLLLPFPSPRKFGMGTGRGSCRWGCPTMGSLHPSVPVLGPVG